MRPKNMVTMLSYSHIQISDSSTTAFSFKILLQAK